MNFIKNTKGAPKYKGRIQGKHLSRKEKKKIKKSHEN
jgi:hypothetical protein